MSYFVFSGQVRIRGGYHCGCFFIVVACVIGFACVVVVACVVSCVAVFSLFLVACFLFLVTCFFFFCCCLRCNHFLKGFSPLILLFRYQI